MELVILEEVKDHLPKGFDPYTIFLIMVDDNEVGRLVLRSGDESSRYFDGHIGYTIDEEYRGHNYAYQACLLLKEYVTEKSLIITCDPNNIASKKTIEKLGCEYIETKPVPKSLKKYFSKDELEKCIYRWHLDKEDL